ncbi:MAG: hypothetical protein ACO3IN_03415 [Steroidobacteraceae bacterium]
MIMISKGVLPGLTALILMAAAGVASAQGVTDAKKGKGGSWIKKIPVTR